MKKISNLQVWNNPKWVDMPLKSINQPTCRFYATLWVMYLTDLSARGKKRKKSIFLINIGFLLIMFTGSLA